MLQDLQEHRAVEGALLSEAIQHLTVYFFFVFHTSQTTLASVQLCILVSLICPNAEACCLYRGSVLERAVAALTLKRARYKKFTL